VERERQSRTGEVKQLAYFFDANITHESANDFIKHLREHQNDKDALLQLRINSNGGDLSATMDIAKQMAHSAIPVATIAETRALSGGLIILAAGHPGLRFAYEDTQLMIHQVQWTIPQWHGSNPEFFDFAKERLKINRNMFRFMAEHTNLKVSEWLELTQEDRFINPHDAKEFGIIDHVVPIGGGIEWKKN
jgi:ATP-dependent Clp protease, protease subunit